ncbi:MAG TPA: flagellar motor switch protein FliN [Polyangiaceae bacterium]|nr:flagellar motor switch protein FliN [Polyangiaceae bacterium]
MTEGSIPPPTPSSAPGQSPALGRDGNHDDSPLSSLRSADSLGFVMDVPVELSVEIGRRVMRLGELLKLGPDSVLELDKLSGEPLDIYANKRLVARGEAVVIGERYGVRLKEVLVVDDRRVERP